MDEARAKLLSEAQYYLSIQRFQQSRALLRELLGDEPRNPDLLYMLAVCEYGLDDNQNAKRLCREVKACGDPSDPRPEGLLGRIALSEHDYPASEHHLLAALRLDPEDSALMALYAEVLLRAGHREKGLRVLEEARRLDPEGSAVLRVTHLFHHAQGEQKGEDAALAGYMLHGTDEVRKRMMAAQTALSRGRHREARERVREAFLLNPTDEGILNALRHLEAESHLLMAPTNLIGLVGGPGAVWIGAMVIIFGSRTLGWTEFSAGFALFYLLFAIYTWVVPPLLRRYYRAR